MSVKPILFTGAMVRANLAGLKTQTRRVVSVHPDCHADQDLQPTPGGLDLYYPEMPAEGVLGLRSTYQAGDILWLRETWKNRWGREYEYQQRQADILYRADGDYLPHDVDPAGENWRPSIFMPKWACRLFRRVIGVRVERLQDISEADACHEGYLLPGGHQRGLGRPASSPEDTGVILPSDSTICREWFRDLWGSINAKPKPVKQGGAVTHYVSYPWEDIQETREHRGLRWIVCGNPWVWVYSYEPCDKPAGWPGVEA